jgi:hypothetical protein
MNSHRNPWANLHFLANRTAFSLRWLPGGVERAAAALAGADYDDAGQAGTDAAFDVGAGWPHQARAVQPFPILCAARVRFVKFVWIIS